MSLNENEIRQRIKFLGDIKIKSITRLKFRDKISKELRNSSTVKEFAANLLPEYISI